MRRRAHLPSRINSCEKVEVIRVAFTRGCGSGHDDVVREVIAYYTPDGDLIAEHDPFPTTESE